MIPDYRSRRALPSLWAILFLAGCCVLSTVITFRARASQGAVEPPALAAAQDTASSKDTASKGAASKDSGDKSADKPSDKPSTDKSESSGTRPPPSKAEESATIEDDPTLVPDSKESADNNVTFPIDI
jgi:hypothetical protein